ncbi:esterase-like activity of phytase family protein [Caulobacter sp.]|uniref:esterase-like activity of phytase family protein n=1 Tax=Caulobacter sp. TaxID=78 RepID=UPI003BB1780F
MIGLRGFLVLGLASVVVSQCAKAPQPAVLPLAPVKAGPEISLVTTPVPLSAANPPPANLASGAIGRFVYAGGVAISSPDTQRLHGLSDLKFGPDGALVSISDSGDLFEARLKLDEAGRLVGLTDGKLQALKGPDGQPLQGKEKGDAEGLAFLANGDRLVSFERDHRIWLYPRRPDGTYGPPRAVNKPATSFPDNEGMEALTAYPIAGPDAYLVGGEEGEVWLCRLSVPCVGLAPQSPPDFTWGLTSFAAFEGQSVAALYRAYDPIRGWRGQVRFVIDPRAPAARQYLAATVTLDGAVSRDNFEGIALSKSPSGTTRIYILSDDNDAPQERTLLMAFDWTAPPPPPPAPPKKPARRR